MTRRISPDRVRNRAEQARADDAQVTLDTFDRVVRPDGGAE